MADCNDEKNQFECNIKKSVEKMGLLLVVGKEVELIKMISLLNTVLADFNARTKANVAKIITESRGRALLAELKKRGLEV